mmetsp:Transcript_45041/g.75766  ORF Transcript_45041/g.75766 Transcript_45041/m.75766 type:complete len:206 (-) Transcript_45041:680-1297(-)
MFAGVSICTAYRRDVRLPISAISFRASSSTWIPSVVARVCTICRISSPVYGKVLTTSRRSKRSEGIPWGLNISVPFTLQRPLLVAKITIGAKVDSNALFKYVKHSTSNMCTSSTNSTPGTSSATPWSMYLLTTLLISCLNFSVISVFLGFIMEFIIDMTSCPPCGRALATSKSCSETSWTISFFLWTSPLGKGTYSSASKSTSCA